MKLNANVLFVGDAWYGSEKWEKYNKQFSECGIRIIYFPYTKGISSTLIVKTLEQVKDNPATAINIT